MKEPIPISLVAHQVFCPRRAWLEAAGERVESSAIEVGVRAAATAHDPRASRPGRWTSRQVASRRLGIVGVCDTLVEDDGSVTVVEHKATPKRRSMTVTAATRTQLVLQGLALQEMGVRVDGHAVWFSTHRRRTEVVIAEEEIRAAEEAVQATRATIEGRAPDPLIDDPRCAHCSHVSVCLPDERRPDRPHRPIAVSDPTGRVVHLVTQGARASIRQGRMRVHHRGEEIASIPVEQIHAVMVHGNVDLSGATIREMLWRHCPILWLRGSGGLVGWAGTAHSPNGNARHLQHTATAALALDLAREMVSAKIANQATILRRHGDAAPQVRRLRTLQRRARVADDLPRLLGVEGEAASVYFAHFSGMLSERVRRTEGITFETRTRRPALDPMNAALNYAYSLLVAEAVRAIVACGLDPGAGFLHSPVRNRPALALDLVEEFRAPIADAVVIAAFNNGELKARSFTGVLGDVRFRDAGRRALVSAFERRMTTHFRHPVFGYRVTWRRAVEVQARLVLGVIDGSQPRYVGIRVR